MHAALNDHVGIRFRGLPGELQRVANDVGDAVVDLRRHVVMRQDHGVADRLEVVDRFDVRGELRPLDSRNHARDALI